MKNFAKFFMYTAILFALSITHILVYKTGEIMGIIHFTKYLQAQIEADGISPECAKELGVKGDL